MDKILNLPMDAAAGAPRVDHLIHLVHWLMFAMFAGWFLFFLYVLFRFNKKRNPKADYTGVTSHTSTYLEVTVAIIEAVLLIGLAIPIWAHAVDQFPKAADSTVIKVIGHQFDWYGWYPGPGGVFATNDFKLVTSDNPLGLDKKDPHYKENFIISKDFVVPVNKPVIVYISSLDVIHCFALRPMRVTQDAIPGMVIPAWFVPVQKGTYQINCAQLCGNGHYAMRGTMKVVSQEEYDKWVAKKEAANNAAGAGGGLE